MIENIATQFQNLSLSLQIFLASLAASILIVLADYETGISLKLPSGRRLGLAGLVLAAGTGYSFILDNGVIGFIIALRAEIFTITILAVATGYLLKKNGVI